MKTYTLLYKDAGIMERQEFDTYESLKYFVNNYVDDSIEVKVIENTWWCVSQTPNIFKTPL